MCVHDDDLQSCISHQSHCHRWYFVRMDEVVDVHVIFPLDHRDPKAGSGTADDASCDSYPTASTQRRGRPAGQAGPPHRGGRDRPRQACKRPR